MKSHLIMYSAIISFLLLVVPETAAAQTILPLDSVENLIIFHGQKPINPTGKKKSFAVVKAWAGERMTFPSMVFSVIHQSKNQIVLKVVTELPSAKSIHPVSFKFDLVVSRKSVAYRADYFYFEDIKLSLEEWLKKYASSDNERHIKNVDIISKGLDSHIFLMLEDLINRINKQ